MKQYRKTENRKSYACALRKTKPNDQETDFSYLPDLQKTGNIGMIGSWPGVALYQPLGKFYLWFSDK